MKRLSAIKNKLKNYLRLCKSLYKDRCTPKVTKVFLWLALAYALSPIDLIPDFIPVIGHLDDVVIVPGLIFIGLKFIPNKLYLEHKRKIFNG